MGTTADKLQGILDSKADIKDAIEAKGVSVGDAKLSEYAGKIAEISGGGQEEALENDVNFYDYDGFRVASFTIAEAKALTQAEYDAILPPTHDGLTFQEWNWTLADIVAYNRRYIDIAANYVTTDGKTRIKISIDSLDVSLVLYGKNQTITVNWGDGSNPDSHEFVDSTVSDFTLVHSYSNIGTYTIIFETDEGKEVAIRKYYWSKNIRIHEINCGTITSFSLTYALYKIAGFLLSVSKDSLVYSSSCISYSSCPIICIPRSGSSYNITDGYPYYYFNGKVCFPHLVAKKSSPGFNVYTSDKRIIIPDSTDITNNTSLCASAWAEIISLPPLTTAPVFSQTGALRELDVPQGWIPPDSLTINQSTEWTTASLVSLFSKLGTTTNAITLTFGATNLNKLTEEQKAIATNKGYTLA